jgi:hypothetical protein
VVQQQQTLAAAPAAHTSGNDAGNRVLAAVLLGALALWAVQLVRGRWGGAAALTLYDLPESGATRPTTMLSRLRR